MHWIYACDAGSKSKIHPNRDAPRCLPCNHTDPLMVDGTCPDQHGFIAPQVETPLPFATKEELLFPPVLRLLLSGRSYCQLDHQS